MQNLSTTYIYIYIQLPLYFVLDVTDLLCTERCLQKTLRVIDLPGHERLRTQMLDDNGGLARSELVCFVFICKDVSDLHSRSCHQFYIFCIKCVSNLIIF